MYMYRIRLAAGHFWLEPTLCGICTQILRFCKGHPLLFVMSSGSSVLLSASYRLRFNRLEAVPPAAGGIALNMAAMAGLMESLHDAFPEWPEAVLLHAQRASLLISTGLIGVLVVRSLSWGRDEQSGACVSLLWRELQCLRTASSHGAALVAMQMAGGSWYSIVGKPAAAVVCFAYALNCLLVLHFVFLACRRRAAPQPFWYPATVSIGTMALVGPTFDAPKILTLASLLLGWAIVVLLYPFTAWSALRSPGTVAPDPSIFVLMAPIPFMSMATVHAARDEISALAWPPGDILLALNAVSVLVCAVCAVARWSSLKSLVCPFIPGWASLTFPLVSNCTLALYFSSAGRRLLSDWLASACSRWATVIVPVTLVLVPLIDLSFAAHIPAWCVLFRAARPEAECQSTGSRSDYCCPCLQESCISASPSSSLRVLNSMQGQGVRGFY